jgi:ribonuclease HI
VKRHTKTTRPAPSRTIGSAGTRHAKLFEEPAHPTDACVANVDGASRNNPGPAAYGVVIRRADGSPLKSLSKYIGVKTNNEAEYFGLVAALDFALAHGVAKLRVRSDSELLVRQMQGHYKVKSAALRPLHEQARKLAAGLAYFSIEHVPREHNREADALANAALDATRGQRSGLSRAEPREDRDQGTLATQRFRARYSGGALHPAEPLDLTEGDEVELTLRKLTRN